MSAKNAAFDLVARLREGLERARGGAPLDPGPALELLARIERSLELLQLVSLNGVEELEHRVQDLSLLARIGEVFGLAFDVDRTARALLELILEAIPCENAVLYYAGSELDVRFGAAAGRTPAADDFEVAERVAWLAMSEPRTVHVSDVQTDPRFQGTIRRARARALVGVPLPSAEEILGVVVLMDPSPNAFPPERMRVLAPVADLAAAAIAHARLCRQEMSRQRDLERMVEERTREVQDARSALARQERTAALGKLAASIAHEVNNPMSYLVSNLHQAIQCSRDIQAALPVLLELLEAVLRLPSSADPRVERVRAIASKVWYATLGDGLGSAATEFGELLAEAREGAIRIQRVGEDLRGFAQGIAGVMEPVDLNTLVEMALQVVEAEAKGRVEFEVRRAALPPVRCRRYEITQVLVSLLQEVIGRSDAPGTVRVATRAVGRQVEVEIADDGPALPPERLARLFEPPSSAELAGGHLGLTIARDIVESHGGSIHAETTPEGNAFTLRLSAARPGDLDSA